MGSVYLDRALIFRLFRFSLKRKYKIIERLIYSDIFEEKNSSQAFSFVFTGNATRKVWKTAVLADPVRPLGPDTYKT